MGFCKTVLPGRSYEWNLKDLLQYLVTKVNGRLTSNANPHYYLLGVRAYLKVLMTQGNSRKTLCKLIRVYFSISVFLHIFV